MILLKRKYTGHLARRKNSPEEEMPLEGQPEAWMDLLVNMALIVGKKGIRNEWVAAATEYAEYRESGRQIRVHQHHNDESAHP